MDKQEELIRITSEYFDDEMDYLKLSSASYSYKTFLQELGGTDLDTTAGREDLQLDSGTALGTLWAALCIDDFVRTRQFMRGIDVAIKEKLQSKDTIHILYAGTGPFASLLLPHMLKYPKERMKYTFLEVNRGTFEVLKTVISALGLVDYDIRLLNEDATKYQVAPDSPDIIISETMQNALAKEQQVSIFYHLMSQVGQDTIFIPQKIEVAIGLKEAGVSSEEIHSRHYRKEQKVFEVSTANGLAGYDAIKQSTQELLFPTTETTLSAESLKGYGQLVLMTDIQVYKDEVIRINESGLTTPLIIKEFSDDWDDPITVRTQYKISEDAKLDYEIT